uniref:Odorant-binding protein 15 n=1 Tax=Cnaphalocrocis medinalis TaxID=437488 RepID=A0A0U3C6L3_CNAME|nr:odorant-binding protein 15 [Cnaphalocrocis medinalis]
MLKLVFTVFCVQALLSEVMGFKKEEVIVKMQECLGIMGLEPEDVKRGWREGDLDPCFLACFYKATKVINSDGMFDMDHTINSLKEAEILEEDKERLSKISMDCVIVNEEEVLDGVEGCERSKLLFDCIRTGLGPHQSEMSKNAGTGMW